MAALVRHLFKTVKTTIGLENLQLLSADPAFDQFGIERIWWQRGSSYLERGAPRSNGYLCPHAAME